MYEIARILTIIALLSTTACDQVNNWTIGETSKINQLSVRLNSKYKRDYDKNNYSLNYEVKDNTTIIIIMRYNHLVDRNLVEKVAGSAEDVIHRVAFEEYGLDDIKIVKDIQKSEKY